MMMWINNRHDNIRSTVFLQCDSMYRTDTDPNFAPIGETEFVNGMAAMSASGVYGPARLCAGIVSFANFFMGAEVAASLSTLSLRYAPMLAQRSLRATRQPVPLLRTPLPKTALSGAKSP
jgi:hypothetical protein